MELIGWIGSIAFAICAFPQAYLSYKQGHSDGMTWAFLVLWFIGETFSLVYVLPKGHLPLIFNYVGNIVLTGIIIYYKIKPRRKL